MVTSTLFLTRILARARPYAPHPNIATFISNLLITIISHKTKKVYFLDLSNIIFVLNTRNNTINVIIT